MPGFNRLLRLAETTCGDDAKVAAGLTEDLIRERDPAGAGDLRRAFAVPGDGRLSCRAPGRTASAGACRAPSTVHPRRTPREFVELVYEFLIDQSTRGSTGEADTMTAKPTVLLTGAAHGIGRATAVALARRGTPLGLIDRDGAALADLAQDAAGRGRDRRHRGRST